MASPQPKNKKQKKRTYWDKYPQLRLLKALGKRRLISFMFFSYVFLFSSAEFTNTMKFKNDSISTQVFIAGFIVLSVYSFDYGINTCRTFFLVPFMSITISALTLFILMFGHMVKAIVEVPADEYLLLAFHIYIFGITAAVSLMLAKGIDVMWQGFFLLGELYQMQGVIEKLRTNAPLEEEPAPEQRKRQKKNGVQKIIIERARQR